MRKVNILGQEYEIIVQTEEENPKLKDAYGICEHWAHKIILLDMDRLEKEPETFENIDEFEKKVLRHEIIHAFFKESGLSASSDFAENEELVDWLAIQFPKIFDVFYELGCMG